ncbi:bifunctional DedA family/phosphatase PAP2 family protein [Sulfurimonas autotrophica]|uniref:Phosphoesterase PA-phosphatase related protein n=1 Tax=Sulfurimonas autotrophica (strain ATCC BAA-671 / DSM 16294 / JCM 11897 / OK10) TaxID=563040 RepID=E0UR90_SULAO|nr:bifunctional DedA family/phosphatase PAP2 family protein [Sulfurimonas autotrophica]ADN08900.1 phosphoesterase PA-phosphatase related protein [Sulfurimonas autotrophica DSM 16294]
MSDILNHSILPFVEHFQHYAVWVVFFAAFSETLIGLGFLLPGSTFLLLLGVLAGQGYFDITSLLLFAVAGAYLGDITNYHIGKHYGTALLGKTWMPFSNEQLSRAHKFLNTHGAKSVFLARFLPGLKESVPFLAGSVKMKQSKFLFWDFFGTIGWSFEVIGIGYLFSASLVLAQIWLGRTITVLAILIFLLALLYLLKQFVVSNAHSAKIVLLSLCHSFLRNPFVSGIIKAHPKSAVFIKSRFDQTEFYGLPLTLLGVALVFVLALFTGIIEDFLTQDPIVYVDHIVANLMVGWRTPEITNFFTWITYLGSKDIVMLFLAAATIVLVLYKKYNDFVALYLSVLGSAVFLYLCKLVFQRPRPETALYIESSYSFPSGHATIAVAFYGFLGYLLIRHVDALKSKINIFFITTILVLLIGLSRIYLGEHYISDVYSGYLIGSLWVITAIVLLQWLSYQKFFLQDKPFGKAKTISITVASIGVGLFLFSGLNVDYKLAVHPKIKIVKLDKFKTLFDINSNRFAQNIFGFDSQSINIIITVEQKEEICPILKKVGWKDLHNNENLNIPIFWQAKEPICSLNMKKESRLYILQIWDTNALYKGKRVYVTGANAIVGERWGIIPVFIKDLDDARDFVVKDLLMKAHFKKDKPVQINKPFIKENLFGDSYFSDGGAEVLLLEK